MMKRIAKSTIGAAGNLLAMLRGRHPSQMWGRVFDLSKKMFVDLSGGYGVYVMPGDYIGNEILKAKSYEPHVTALIRTILIKDDVFLDLGANVGYFTLLAASLLKDTGRVIAFEPNPQNQQLIYASILKNGFSNVKLYPYAVSDSESILRFTTVGSNGGVVTDFSRDQRYFLLVQSVVLDNILKNETRIDVVKIDIEAHEPSAIRGMAALINKHKPKIITEYHPWAMQLNNAEAPLDYLQQIYRFGYSLSIIEPMGNLLTVSSADDIMHYWKALDNETAHLDLFAQPS
jgi:FkbM family methyltransferase